MDKNKLVLPISIILGCFVLGGFFYASQSQKQAITEKELTSEVMSSNKGIIDTTADSKEFEKKVECEKYNDKIQKRIKEYNLSQKPEIRDSSVPTNPEEPINHLYIENNVLKELFYSPKVDSCLYIESRRTLMKSDPNASPADGDWSISFETYYLIDALSGEEIDFNDGLPFLQMIHRSDRFNSEDYANELINKYK